MKKAAAQNRGCAVKGSAEKMVADIDIWRFATVQVDRHGADALTVAEQRASEMICRGDAESLAVWKRVGAAIQELLNTEPRGLVH